MRHVEGTPFGARGGMSVVHTFPADGTYMFPGDPGMRQVTEVALAQRSPIARDQRPKGCDESEEPW